MAIDFNSTVKGSLLEGFFPKGWNMKKFDKISSISPKLVTKPESWWNEDFKPVKCETLADFDTYMGHEIAMQIAATAKEGRQLAMILPVGPMGMYRWAVHFLKQWDVSCEHVHGFNMDEWSDAKGNTLAPDDPAAFQCAMEGAFYGPLGELTVPKKQRHFATKSALPKYPEQIAELKNNGAKLVVVYGIGRMMHIAFWEPQFAEEFGNLDDWKNEPYRVAAKLHPLTIEQNAITSFKSRTTLVSCRANTIGPGLFLQADWAIGGADGTLGRGMMWQGMSFLVTLHHAPSKWIPSTWMPTMPGRLFYLKELEGPLEAECN